MRQAAPLDGLPHAYPFRLVDRVFELDGKKAVGVKNVTANEALAWQRPAEVLPDVLLIEALAQLSGLVMNFGKESRKKAFLAQVKGFRFVRQACAGEAVRLLTELEASFAGLSSFRTSAYTGTELLAEGTVVLAEITG